MGCKSAKNRAEQDGCKPRHLKPFHHLEQQPNQQSNDAGYHRIQPASAEKQRKHQAGKAINQNRKGEAVGFPPGNFLQTLPHGFYAACPGANFPAQRIETGQSGHIIMDAGNAAGLGHRSIRPLRRHHHTGGNGKHIHANRALGPENAGQGVLHSAHLGASAQHLFPQVQRPGQKDFMLRRLLHVDRLPASDAVSIP